MAADPALIHLLDGFTPRPVLVGEGTGTSVGTDGGEAAVVAIVPASDPQFAVLTAVMAAMGAQAASVRSATLPDGGTVTSFAVAFATVPGARAVVRRATRVLLAQSGAATGLDSGLDAVPGGRVAIAVMPGGGLRTLAIASRGEHMVGTVTARPGSDSQDLPALVTAVVLAWQALPPPAPGVVEEVAVTDALRLQVRATWAAAGRQGAEVPGSMLAARVEGAVWVMADMGTSGVVDLQLFREATPGGFRAEGAVPLPGACPAIPMALRDAWGFQSECVTGDTGVPLPGTEPAGMLPEPVRGVGMWIWYVSESERSLQAIIDRARTHGIRTVYIKSGDGVTYWSQFDRAVGPLKAAGLRVCAWQYVRGRTPVAEAAVAARAVRAGADCFMVDAETEFETLSSRYVRARRYMRALRARVGTAYPVGLTTFPYVDLHGRFPYTAFLSGPDAAQFTMPQVYWRAFRVAPTVAVERTMRWNRIYGRPIALLGGTSLGESPAQIRRFRCASRAAGVQGEGWWAWQGTRVAQWRELAAPLTCQTALPAQPRYPSLGATSRGDTVRRLQELLGTRGYRIPVDGVFGAATRGALATYRAERGLAPASRTDDAVWADLLQGEGSLTTSRTR